MTNKLFIPVILGTARENRVSEKAAKFVLGEMVKFTDIETELLDVRDYRLEATDNTKTQEVAKKLSEKISRADGLIIVSPEYNHGYPGELKMMLDMLYQEYFKKPVGICGVSMGGLGGARMVEQLRLVAIELRMVPIREAVYFSNASQLFDEGGNMKDQSYVSKLKTFIDEMSWYAGVLKEAREK